MAYNRSKWKGILLKKKFLTTIKNKSTQKLLPIKIYNRNTIIAPYCIGNTFEIFNGIKFIPVNVTDMMVGHKFGEFSPTRKKNIFKKK